MTIEEENTKLKFILGKLLPENSGQYFIFGEAGDKDRNGVPEYILVCAAYGSDAHYKFKRVD